MIDTHNNPWLGLESYQENQIIYGRNEEISDLAQRVLNDVDTVLYGKSGIGKTSIINAGVLPIARQNGYIPVVVRLDHSNSKKYIGQIRTLIEGVAQVKEKIKAKDPTNELLWEYLHRHEFWCNGERCKLLIIFDQFEEIFTLQTDPSARTAFFNEIGDVLNKVMPLELVGKDMEMQQSKADDNETVVEGFASLSGLFKKKIADDSSKTEFDYVDDNDIHFIFALREDFLSDFEYYTAKIPSLKHHRFGLRPLNEEQAADIITKPRPGLVSIDVARLIIETVTGRSDFSLGDDPEIEVDAAVLSLFLSRLYQKLAPEDSIISLQLVTESGSNIIKDFYTESIGILTPQEVVLLEDQLLTSTGRRNNVSYSDFQKLIPKAKINELVQTKKLLRAFNYGNDIRLEFIHDILCPIVKERKEQREQLRLQEEERKRQEEETQRAIAEEQRKREELEKRATAEKAQLRAEAIRVRRRNRNRIRAILGAIAVVLAIVGACYYCFFMSYSEVYGNFTTKDGWPVGLGDQIHSSKDKEKCTVYYKLVREGRLASFLNKPRPFTKVEILNWKGDRATNVFIESPVVRIVDRELNDVKAAEFANMLSRVSYWQYIADSNGMISTKTAFDINKKELYSEHYSTINNDSHSSKYVLWCMLYDKDGNSLQISDNGTDRIRYTVANGYITGCSFFTNLGTPQVNTSEDYGYSYQVDSVTANIVSQCKIDKFGDKIDTSLVHYTAFENGRYVQSDLCSVEYAKQNVTWRFQGHKDSIHITEKGFVDYIRMKFNSSESVSAKYKSKEQLKEKKRYSKGMLNYSAKYFYSSRLDSVRIYDSKMNPHQYTEKWSYPRKNIMTKSFWSNGNKLTLFIGEGDISCHKVVLETTVKGNEKTITTSYLDGNNLLTKEGKHSKSMIIRDAHSNNILFEYYYDCYGEICKSEMFTYNEYGIQESRSVAGIDRTPVRCPHWDQDGWCYYKMKFIKSHQTDKLFFATKAIDEMGNQIPVTQRNGNDLFEFSYHELPVNLMQEENQEGIILGESASLLTIKKAPDMAYVPYVHLLSKKGTFYQAKALLASNRGLKDGDILVAINGINILNEYKPIRRNIDILIKKIQNSGGEITVMRIEKGKYRKLTFAINRGYIGAEYHITYIHPNITLNI